MLQQEALTCFDLLPNCTGGQEVSWSAKPNGAATTKRSSEHGQHFCPPASAQAAREAGAAATQQDGNRSSLG